MAKGKIFVREGNKEDVSIDINVNIISQNNQMPSDVMSDDAIDDEVRYKKNIIDIENITYEQIYQLLLSLLKGNKITLHEILHLAKIMYKEGLRTPEIKNLKPEKAKISVITENISQKQNRSR